MARAQANLYTRLGSYRVCPCLAALPLGFAQAGWAVGTLMALASGALAILSLHLLFQSAATVMQRSGETTATFYAVCEAALPGSGVFVDAVVVINGFMAGASFLIVATDSLERIAATSHELRDLWTLVAVFLVLPLALLRKLDALKVMPHPACSPAAHAAPRMQP